MRPLALVIPLLVVGSFPARAETSVAAPKEPPSAVVLEQIHHARDFPEATGMALQAELKRWNEGDAGGRACDPPGAEGHPDPRIVLNVLSEKGPRTKASVQAHARKFHWINIRSCYATAARNNQNLSGTVNAKMTISPTGKVTYASVVKKDIKDKTIAKCMTRTLKKLRFSRTRAASDVTLEMRVYPGDDPIPPAPGRLPPSMSGKMDLAKAREKLVAQTAELNACYEKTSACQPGLWGRLLSRMEVDAQGKVTEAFETQSAFPSEPVKTCVMRVLRGLEFAPPEGGPASVTADLRFGNPNAITAPVSTDDDAANEEPAAADDVVEEDDPPAE